MPSGRNNRVKKYEYFQPFEEEISPINNRKVIATVALFAPNETLKLHQYKYHKISHLSVA